MMISAKLIDGLGLMENAELLIDQNRPRHDL